MLWYAPDNVATRDLEVPFRIAMSVVVLAPPCLEVAELLEVCSRSEDMGTVDDAVFVIMVVAAENDVNQPVWRFLGEFDVVRLPCVGQRDDNVSTFFAQSWNQLDRSAGRRLVD